MATNKPSPSQRLLLAEESLTFFETLANFRGSQLRGNPEEKIHVALANLRKQIQRETDIRFEIINEIDGGEK